MTARLLVALLALTAITLAVATLESAEDGLVVRHASLGGAPAIIRVEEDARPAPVVVIAHGFAGSRQLMAPFAVTLAQNGYVAVSFDFQGHGRNPVPLAGDVTREDGATLALVSELERVLAAARALPESDGRAALLGHSMASDIVVRAAVADPSISATIAVSMFSTAVTATTPENLLIIVGAWERFLSQEALKAVALAGHADPEEAVTYGEFVIGSARRAAFADNAEHVGVLYSGESLTEALAWLDAVFNRADWRSARPTPVLDLRGPWILLLLIGIAALAWPLSKLLPPLARRPSAPLSRGRLLAAGAAPALATPLLLWPVPTQFLPVLVADYLALHFLVYGALTLAAAAVLARSPAARAPLALGPIEPTGRPTPRRAEAASPSARSSSASAPPSASPWALVAAIAAATLFGVGAVALALDRYVANFVPHAGRLPILLALGVGAVAYTLADERLIRRPGAPWWAYGFTKLCFLASLAAAIALDLQNLFFLIIIAPVLVAFFALYGLFSGWLHRATGHPTVAGVANGVAFAWALAVTFPLLAG